MSLMTVAKCAELAEPRQHLALPVDAIVAASGGVAVPGPDVAGEVLKLDGVGG
jgi:dihydrofolate synthase/folylpolyglutamate synthase